jgi:DNA polymerase elongation subunit (family B)
MRAHIYGLDIETDTTPLADGSARGLDPATTTIVNIALSVGEDVIVFRGEERNLLVALDRYLLGLQPGLIATWNGAVFDLPFIADRADAVGVQLGLELSADRSIVPKYEFLPGHNSAYQGSWASSGSVPHAHMDVAYALKENARALNIAWSLKPVARHYGLSPMEVDRTAVHLLSAEEQDAYVASDARVTAALAARLLHGRL